MSPKPAMWREVAIGKDLSRSWPPSWTTSSGDGDGEHDIRWCVEDEEEAAEHASSRSDSSPTRINK